MSNAISEKNKIGLIGIILAVTGFVVGVSIYILPAKMIIIAGPAVLLAYILAGAMAVLNCATTAQIGAVMPAEGGSFVAISRLLSPFFGFLMVWILLFSVVLVNGVLAYGFAEYFLYFMPELNKMLIALYVILFFGLINLLGSKIVVKLQGLMVALFMVMLIIFIISGVPHFEVTKLIPFMPNGVSSLMVTTTIAYFSFSGFVMLLELGGEIKNPARNIPLGLGISLIIVVITYLSISLMLAAIDIDSDFVNAVTPLLEVAKVTLPGWFIVPLVLSILAAAATTINALILGYSRDILVLARAKILPGILAKTMDKTGTPQNAIIFFTLMSASTVFFGDRIVDFVIVAVLGLMAQQVALAVCLFRMPVLLKSEYNNSDFKIKKPLLYTVAGLLMLVSVAFIIMNIMERPSFGIILLCVASFAGIYYFIIAKYWATKNISVKEVSLALADELSKK